jgi:hypothetical protein
VVAIAGNTPAASLLNQRAPERLTAASAEASQEKQACHDDQGEMTQSPSCRCPRKASSTMSPIAVADRR